MRRVNSKIALLVALVAVLAASHSVGAGREPQPQATDYRLDDARGQIALYPGLAYRSYVASKYVVPSLEELERRVGQLPAGTRLHWTPYKRDPSGKPLLFSESQYDRFARFCRDHKIELLISPGHPSSGKTG